MTITFSEAVSGFTNADLTVANGTLTPVSSADGGITWTATFTPTADINDTTNLITLDNTGVADGAGNAGWAPPLQQLRDRHAASDGDHRGGRRGAEGRRNLAGDHHLQRGGERAHQRRPDDCQRHADAGVVVDGGITWTATFTPTVGIKDTSNVITLDNTGVADGAGNTGCGTTARTTTRSTRGTDGDHRGGRRCAEAGETSLVTITFSEAVSGLTNDDLTIANGTLTPVSSADGGITWTATFTPTVAITDTSNLITLDNTGVADGAGNTGWAPPLQQLRDRHVATDGDHRGGGRCAAGGRNLAGDHHLQ